MKNVPRNCLVTEFSIVYRVHHLHGEIINKDYEKLLFREKNVY